MGGLVNGLQSFYVNRSSSKDAKNAAIDRIKERQTEIENDCMGWNQFCIFPEATTTNGSALIKFKRGPFEAMKTVQPCFVKFSDRMIAPCFDSMEFWVNFIMIASSLCMYNCTLYIMPEFTPTNKMLQMHEDKGSEDWEIYAECIRAAMAKTGKFD